MGQNRNLRLFIFLFLGYVLSGSSVVWAQAKGDSAICSTIYRSNNYGCGDSASSNSAGASLPLIFDAINLSPSNLPLYEAPVGVEAFMDHGKWNFSLIKGNENVGAGFSYQGSPGVYFSGFENYKINLKTLNGYIDSALAP